MHSNIFRGFLCAAIVLLTAVPALAQVDARMLRYPAVSKDRIAFVYAGDIWLVDKNGGSAFRLTSSPGEESFPRFSPDGSLVAFSAAYDGNQDVYVIPAAGGEPVRLTHHPMADRVVGWTPDGTRVLFVSGRESGRQRYGQFYTVGTKGGMPEKLVVPYGEFGSYSPDGRQFAYMPMAQDFRNWKRYRGGWSPDIWLFDLTSKAAKNITTNPANDAQPMWHGTTIYFVSDRDAAQRNNLWAYDVKAGSMRQVTQFRDFDITFPSLGPDGIVFQAGGRLYLLDLASGKPREVPVRVVTDEATLRPRTAKADGLIQTASVSPTGKRALFEARGDIFSAPAEFGPVMNATRSSGVAERFPRWSPDGKWLAFWSDKSGEYELHVRPAEGPGAERKVTSLGAGFRYPIVWSPDSRKAAFIDQAMRIHVVDIESGKAAKIDESPEWINHGGLQAFGFDWSADSKWLTYSRPTGDTNSSIFLYDTRGAKVTRVTTGYLNDTQPAFDPDGKYLYYASDREFTPVYGSFDNSWTYPNPTRLMAVPLRRDVQSPLYTRNDYEASEPPKKPEEPKADAAQAKPSEVDIDLTDFEARAVVLPPPAGNYADLQATKGRLLYRRLPRSGSSDTKSPVVFFDFNEREEKTVLEDAAGFEVTEDGKKMLTAFQGRFAILEIKSPQKFEKPIATAEMEAPVDPRAEWKQMFEDTYRFYRDYFYDPGMHGVDWAAMKGRYGKLLEDAVTRWDVDFIIGELIGELNASHTYYGGGDKEAAPARNVGMLGIDWELGPASGGNPAAYRVKKIIRGGPWDSAVRAPLAEPGVNVKEGEYVLAVNGIPIDTGKDPWAAFQGLGDKAVVLTVNAKPVAAGARQVLVRTIGSEVELRFRDWIEERRQIVDKATGGKVGYIYVQSTGVDAQNELVRQFMGQWKKEGLIIDERWNGGGQIPDRFIELLNRPILAYWAVRDGQSWQWPPVAARGPQVMLINGWSGSGGDAFPTYFKQAGMGPLIGTRTWGGLIGISGAPTLVDGGTVSVPTFRMYDPKGTWFAEGHGVEPDIEVIDDPSQLASGTDPQLARAIKEVQDRIAKAPKVPTRPAPELRVPKSQCGMRNAECGMRNAECGMRNARPHVPQTESRRQVSNAVNVLREVHVSKAWLLAALIACGTMGVGHAHRAQSSASTDPSLALPTAEGFPLHDSSVTFAYLDDLRRQVAARRLVQAPRDPDTLRLLVSLRQWDDVLSILEGIADAPAPVIAAHLDALGFEARQMLSDKARNYAARLRTVVDAIARTLVRFDREEQAAVARQLVNIESELDGPGATTWYPRLRAFVQAYAGTRAAVLTQVDLLNESSSRSLVDFEAFARERPGTEAAAKALYLAGFNLGHNASALGERPGADPTDRFFRVLEITRELRSGKYPRCEWVEKAIDLPLQFFAFQPKYAPGNPERILAALEGLLPEVSGRPREPSRPDLGYIVGSRMGELYKASGGGLSDVEALFDRLATGPHRDVVLLARAEYYLRPSERVVEPNDWPSLRPKAAAILERLVREGSGFPQQKALATLATLRFVDRDYAAAASLYEEYVRRYPETSYAWLASLRIGMSEQGLGRSDRAVEAFRHAAIRFASVPVAATLAHTYAGRASEADGRFADALSFYRSALAARPGREQDRLSAWPSMPAESVPDLVDRSYATRGAVASRVDELTRSLAVPGGALIERARWLMSHERWRDSLEPLGVFTKTHGRSPLLQEARALGQRARLELALARVDADGERGDPEGAVAELRKLLAEPAGFEATAARIALATLEALRGNEHDADEQMRLALEQWKALDAARPRARANPLHADVLAIRNVVFQPGGGGVFEQARLRWNAFRWEAAPYQLANPDVRVKHGDGSVTTLTIAEPFPGLDGVLFLDGPRRAVVERLMLKLGGTKRKPWTRVMDTPNQPAGPSLTVQAFWNRFFFVQPGHWGGWVFETYPIIGEIEFVDAARTRAAVPVTVGYSGATVLMEKRDGAWIATELTNYWIT